MSKEIDPVAFHLGTLEVRWYGLLFLGGLIAVWLCMRRLAIHHGAMRREAVDDAMLWISIGTLVGGRMGEMVFYEPSTFLHAPLDAIMIIDGGMSFHGGLIGVFTAILVYSKTHDVDFFKLADIASASAPAGLFLGRIGNFLNGELYGPLTDSSFGFVFPSAGALPRHPTQIYEALLEGVVLGAVLYPLAYLNKHLIGRGFISGLFLIGYAIVRMPIEFFRLDGWISYNNATISISQLLCICMLFAGTLIIWRTSRQRLDDRDTPR